MPVKIFIDQGHNPMGINAGAEGNGLREQDINYEVGVLLAQLFETEPDFEVRLSRPTENTYLGTSTSSSLAARVDAANEWGADYFISIHANASTNPSANGTEVYVYSQDSSSYGLAHDILDGIVTEAGTRNNDVRVNSSLYVLRNTKMPAVLVELGYITNEGDAEKLRDEPDAFARGIFDGVMHFIEQ